MTTLQLKPCGNCGIEYQPGAGWLHSRDCIDYDPPKELTIDDLYDLFGDEDPAKYI